MRVTYEDGDTNRFTAEALQKHDKIDTIVVAGGDGSINEVSKVVVD